MTHETSGHYATPPLPPGYAPKKDPDMSEVEKVVVTAGPKAPRDKSVIETTTGKSDVQVVVIGWFRQAGIRTVRTYLQALVGVIAAGGTGAAAAVGVNMPAGDFLALVGAGAGLALAPAVIAFLQNAIEILTKLDRPETRA